MKQLISKEDVKPIVCSLFVSLLAGFLVNILVLLSVMIAKDGGQLCMQILNEMSLLIALVVIPYFIYTKMLGYRMEKIEKKKTIVAIVFETLVFVILSCFFDIAIVLHYLVIATAEEIHFRKFQYEFLNNKLDMKKALIISSAIFAFVLHLNDPILGNLMIRLPLGIVLCLIRYKFGLRKSIAAHWIYDVIVSMV